MAIFLTILTILGWSPTPARVAAKAGIARYPRARESCFVDAPSTYLEQTRQLWCADGSVARVSLRTDTRNYVAQVYLSPAGQSAWRASAAEAVAPFTQLVNDVAQSFRMNVTVTIRKGDGARLAVCSRDLIARTATCSIR